MLYRFVKIHGWKFMDFSKLLHGIVNVDISGYMDLSIGLLELFSLLHGDVKVVLCISRSLPNKTKLKFDQDFNAC